jgi:glycosyltransferase involved in cell wall biosynthesis
MNKPDETLSLCMIVRNCERSLRQALVSARPFVDELVVVDTGSTDGTRAIAVKVGARVIDFPWRDDFSAARNFSLENATSKWLFWMDADDILPAECGQELRKLIAAHPGRDAAFWVNVEEESVGPSGRKRIMTHAHVKLFPRHPQIRFHYRIHEQIAPAIRNLGMPIHRTTAFVRHEHADRSPEADRARTDRNLRLALLDFEEHPDDPFVCLSVGTAYLHQEGSLEMAVEFLQRSLAGFSPGSTVQLNAFLYLGEAYGIAGDRHKEQTVYSDALKLFPNDAMLLMRLAACHERLGEPIPAIRCYETALKSGKLRTSSVQLRDGFAQVVLRLGKLYADAGRPQASQSLWLQYLQAHPDAHAIRQALFELQLNSPSIIVR